MAQDKIGQSLALHKLLHDLVKLHLIRWPLHARLQHLKPPTGGVAQ